MSGKLARDCTTAGPIAGNIRTVSAAGREKMQRLIVLLVAAAAGRDRRCHGSTGRGRRSAGLGDGAGDLARLHRRP
jgi:hypothetical protein